MRVSDAEREQVVELLQQHFVDGRLDHDELTTRTERVWRSQTRGELQQVLQDLPAGPRLDQPLGRQQVSPPRGAFPRFGLSTTQIVLLVIAAIVLLPIVLSILRWTVPLLIVAGIVYLFLRRNARC